MTWAFQPFSTECNICQSVGLVICSVGSMMVFVVPKKVYPKRVYWKRKFHMILILCSISCCIYWNTTQNVLSCSSWIHNFLTRTNLYLSERERTDHINIRYSDYSHWLKSYYVHYILLEIFTDWPGPDLRVLGYQIVWPRSSNDPWEMGTWPMFCPSTELNSWLSQSQIIEHH